MIVTQDKVVTLEDASKESGIPIHTLRYWLRKKRLLRYKRAADSRVFVNLAQVIELATLRPVDESEPED